MIKDFLRIIGCACIIAGTILYFSTEQLSLNNEDASENSQLKNEIATLQSELKMTTEELASLQLSLNVAETPSKETTEEPTEPVSDSPTPAPSGKLTLLIERGMDSTIVANELENAGIIKDASEFERYLVTSKLAGKIQIGEYELTASMSNQDIINLITSSK